jgi:hypothetical protein
MLAAALASIALLPGVLTPTVAEVKPDTRIPILLPSTFQANTTELFGSRVEASPNEYRIQLTSVEDCQANYCSVAWFTGAEGVQLRGTRKVALANGRSGRYRPMSCGASCAPAAISWKERSTGVVYSIESGKSRSALVKLANSAIRKGPR